jgi:hydroxymethylpyrimidine pyrophosphatase-like HAD family hydrolase
MSGGVNLSKVAQIIEAVLFLENDALTIERLSKLTDHTELVVSNALDEVKAVADIVLPHSNDEGGVARYLENIK